MAPDIKIEVAPIDDVKLSPLPPPAPTPIVGQPAAPSTNNKKKVPQTTADVLVVPPATSPPVPRNPAQDKPGEPLIVLPPDNPQAPKAKVVMVPTVTPTVPVPGAQAQPPRVESSPAKSWTPPNPAPVVSPRPTNQEAGVTPAPPAKPKAFQLVRPIRPRTVSAPPLAPIEPSPWPERPVLPAQPVAQSFANAPANSVPANATPQLTVEKKGPATLRAGEPLQFIITVRNVGQTSASQVRVEDDIPPGTRMTFADPRPVLQTDRAVWVLPTLAAGAEKQLKIEIQAQTSGELVGSTNVMVSASTGIKSHVSQDSLTLWVSVPAPVPNGFPVVFEVHVTNHTKQTMTGLVLHGRLPAGLSHPAGTDIEADVGDLGAGVTKMFKMPVTAKQPGRHTVDVRISTSSGLEANGQATVLVIQGAGTGLTIEQAPLARLFLDKEGELRIRVTNHQEQGLKNVTVVDTLPDGVDYLSASDQGLYHPDTRTAYWLVDYLPAGQTAVLTMRVKGKTAGQFDNAVALLTDARQEMRSTGKIDVTGVTDLVLKVIDKEPAIEVGAAALYEIKVTNQGSLPATGVQVQATLPDGMKAKLVRGPTKYRVDGRQVIFATLPKLQPQGQAVFFVSALTQQAGDQRFRVQVVSDQNRRPLACEERTYVYRD